MTPFFTRERFGRPQFIAGFLLLAFFFQCLWMAHLALRPSSNSERLDQPRIAEGLRQWRGQRLAGAPSSPLDPTPVLASPQPVAYDANRSPLWYLIAAAPFVMWSSSWNLEAIPYWGWLARAPYIGFGLLLGASLWYVARRLFGNAGGYIALALYCFSPGMIIASSAAGFVEPEIGAVWGAFGSVFTSIAVAHTLYAPREVVVWNWRRILLLGLSLALAIGSLFSLALLVPLTLGLMLWVAPTRRAAATTIWVASTSVGLLLLWAAYSFHMGAMWQGFRHAHFMQVSAQALVTAGVYKQVAALLARTSPALMVALPVALVTFLAWPRARYFGNTAPLLLALLFLILGMANPHLPGAAFYWIATTLLFVFVSGVFADLLETTYRPLVTAMLWGLLLASATWNVAELVRI